MWSWLWVFFRWESDTIIRSFEVLALNEYVESAGLSYDEPN